MNRRDLIALLGSTAAAMWSLGARAQQTGIPLVGLLDTSSADAGAHLTAFSLGLKESGFAPKQNVAVEYRSAEEQYERLPELAADLINRKVTVLACAGIPATLAAKKATASIPIVFSIGSDPTQIGLVESLNRPGGNITGITTTRCSQSWRIQKPAPLLFATTACSSVAASSSPHWHSVTACLRSFSIANLLSQGD